jgi:hypothetical protein
LELPLPVKLIWVFGVGYTALWNGFLPTYLDDDGKNQVFELCNIVFMTKKKLSQL